MSLLDNILPELLKIISEYRTLERCGDCGLITFEIFNLSLC